MPEVRNVGNIEVNHNNEWNFVLLEKLLVNNWNFKVKKLKIWIVWTAF